MPKLPSGLKVAISRHAILEPNREFFRCPEGHFWYQTPDLAMTLIQQRRREEAREALDTALVLDPDDDKNQYIDEHFDAYFRTKPVLEKAN